MMLLPLPSVGAVVLFRDEMVVGMGLHVQFLTLCTFVTVMRADGGNGLRIHLRF